jgi:hypothetical protein
MYGSSPDQGAHKILGLQTGHLGAFMVGDKQHISDGI